MSTAATQELLDKEPSTRATLVLGDNPTFNTVTTSVASAVENPTAKPWILALLMALAVLGIFGASLSDLVGIGTGEWGLNHPVSWAWDITGFVFWVGIGHAGTLISAILFLFRQKWRTGINRFAEAMTIFAVICAGLFPGIHVGRVWLAYWLFPIPNQMSMWPQFRSPLLWDVFAVSTYFTVSVLFWYMGLIPDLATLRDRATTKMKQAILGIFAVGWRGSARHWQNYERAYLILAAISTPLVLIFAGSTLLQPRPAFASNRSSSFMPRSISSFDMSRLGAKVMTFL